MGTWLEVETLVGEGERHWLEQVRKLCQHSVARNALRLEVVLVKLRLVVIELDLPRAALLVLRHETVRIHVGVADHVSILVNAELPPAFIPVAPGVHRAVGLNAGIPPFGSRYHDILQPRRCQCRAHGDLVIAAPDSITVELL